MWYWHGFQADITVAERIIYQTKISQNHITPESEKSILHTWPISRPRVKNQCHHIRSTRQSCLWLFSSILENMMSAQLVASHHHTTEYDISYVNLSETKQKSKLSRLFGLRADMCVPWWYENRHATICIRTKHHVTSFDHLFLRELVPVSEKITEKGV